MIVALLDSGSINRKKENQNNLLKWSEKGIFTCFALVERLTWMYGLGS